MIPPTAIPQKLERTCYVFTRVKDSHFTIGMDANNFRCSMGFIGMLVQRFHQLREKILAAVVIMCTKTEILGSISTKQQSPLKIILCRKQRFGSLNRKSFVSATELLSDFHRIIARCIFENHNLKTGKRLIKQALEASFKKLSTIVNRDTNTYSRRVS